MERLSGIVDLELRAPNATANRIQCCRDPACRRIRLPLLQVTMSAFSSEKIFAHEARVCISSGRVLDDTKRPRDYSAEQYLKSPEEMQELFSDIPEACRKTLSGQTLQLRTESRHLLFAAIPVPDGHTLDSWIVKFPTGFEETSAQQEPANWHTVADTSNDWNIELGVIIKMGFPATSDRCRLTTGRGKRHSVGPDVVPVPARWWPGHWNYRSRHDSLRLLFERF